MGAGTRMEGPEGPVGVTTAGDAAHMASAGRDTRCPTSNLSLVRSQRNMERNFILDAIRLKR